jgi:hypothetical protein
MVLIAMLHQTVDISLLIRPEYNHFIRLAFALKNLQNDIFSYELAEKHIRRQIECLNQVIQDEGQYLTRMSAVTLLNNQVLMTEIAQITPQSLNADLIRLIANEHIKTNDEVLAKLCIKIGQFRVQHLNTLSTLQNTLSVITSQKLTAAQRVTLLSKEIEIFKKQLTQAHPIQITPPVTHHQASSSSTIIQPSGNSTVVQPNGSKHKRGREEMAKPNKRAKTMAAATAALSNPASVTTTTTTTTTTTVPTATTENREPIAAFTNTATPSIHTLFPPQTPTNQPTSAIQDESSYLLPDLTLEDFDVLNNFNDDGGFSSTFSFSL